MAGIEAFEKSERYINYISGNRIPYPENLVLELTTRRSPHCECPQPYFSRSFTNEMDIGDTALDYVLTSILPYVQNLILIGRGDPLLVKDKLLKTLETALEFSVPVTLNTHGLDFSGTLYDAVLNSTVQKLVFTVNASDDETHKAICGCSITPLLDALETFSENRKSSKKNQPDIRFRMVAIRDNMVLLPDLINLAYRYGASSLIVTPVSRLEERKECAFRQHSDETEEIMYRSLIEAEMKGLDLRTDPPQFLDAIGAGNDIDQFLSGHIPPDPGNKDLIKDCTCIWSSAVIDAEGNILPCSGDCPPIGNVERQSFQDIWYGGQFKALRKNYVSGFDQNECLACHDLIWRKKRPFKRLVNPEDAIFFMFPGWYQSELEERAYRFTKDRAVVFLQRDPSDLFVLVQIRKALFEGAAAEGKIIINEHHVHPFQLPSNQWETLEFPLPENSSSHDAVSVEIVPAKTVRPRDTNSDSNDLRALGVKVSRIWLESWAKKVVYAQQLVLLGYEIAPDSWEIDGDAVFRTFWRTLSPTEYDVKILLDLQREDSQETDGNTSSKYPSRISRLQHDFLLEHLGLPTSNWPEGIFIAHEYRMPVPDTLVPGHYRLHLGVYPEGDPAKRIKISRSDREHQDNLALLGTVMIS
jgi:radical SAM protein with 4Fe4S-binding SPASM domain